METGYIVYTVIAVAYVGGCWTTGMYLLSSRILGREPRLRVWALYSAVFYVIQLVLNLFLLLEIMPYNRLAWDVGIFTFQLLVITAFLYHAYRERLLKTVSAAALSHFVVYVYQCVFEASLYRIFTDYEAYDFYSASLLYNALPHTLMLLLALPTLLVLKRVQFSRSFSYLFSSPEKSVFTFVACILLMNSYALLSVFFPQILMTTIYAVIGFSAIVLALFSLQFTAAIALDRERLRSQEETIQQQQAHLRLLEELQTELKSFRHDFQNLLSGAALQAREGDLEGIRAFLQRTAGYFDQKLGNEIKQQSVLGLIGLYPLRSLLTIKLAAMREQGIRAELEILRPVTRCPMRDEDLVRCIGILLDNAIEAAASCRQGLCRVLLLQEERELRIAVSNTCPEKPDLAAMSRPRFSTKGDGRGAGLSSYRRILAGYPECVGRTVWEDGLLTQELRAGLE